MALFLALAVILASARLAGFGATRLGQPRVLGELIAGVVLGNLHLLGFDWLEPFKQSAPLDALAQIGVVLLLFDVGAESTLDDMLRVGPTALGVALVGVITPLVLGWGVAALMLPGRGPLAHVFVGATLTATSVGITARVLKDLGKIHTAEARVILGAAVLDDVLGLVTLTVVTAAIVSATRGSAMSLAGVGWIVAKATLFLVGAIVIGRVTAPRLFRIAAKVPGRGPLLVVGLVLCFGLSYLAAVVGLAGIVGAFAAGLLFEHSPDREVVPELLRPLLALLVPVFFVLMGMRVDLAAIGQGGTVGFALLLTAAAIIGKQACALVPGRFDRIAVGIGMVPRGEVGLIFANVGVGLTIAGAPAVDTATYSAVVTMVIVTTLITPPVLRWRMAGLEGRA